MSGPLAGSVASGSGDLPRIPPQRLGFVRRVTLSVRRRGARIVATWGPGPGRFDVQYRRAGRRWTPALRATGRRSLTLRPQRRGAYEIRVRRPGGRWIVSRVR